MRNNSGNQITETYKSPYKSFLYTPPENIGNENLLALKLGCGDVDP